MKITKMEFEGMSARGFEDEAIAIYIADVEDLIDEDGDEHDEVLIEVDLLLNDPRKIKAKFRSIIHSTNDYGLPISDEDEASLIRQLKKFGILY